MSFTHDVFLSYNRSDPDADDVRELARAFDAKGFGVFLDDPELLEGNRGAMSEELAEALSKTRLIAVCIGSAGPGPTQREEINYALSRVVAADGDGEQHRWPEVVLVRLGNLPHDDVAAMVPDALGKKLSFIYPGNLVDPSFKDLLMKLREDPEAGKHGPDQRDKAPPVAQDVSEAEDLPLPSGELNELLRQIRASGLTVFLGARWPDRLRLGTFDPDEFARYLREACDLPNDVHAGTERLASFAELKLHNQTDALKKLRRRYSARAPQTYVDLADLLRRACDQSGDGARERTHGSFVVVTTAQNGLLEHEFLIRGLSFLMVHVRGDSCRQTLFHVEDKDPLTVSGGRHLDLPAGAKGLGLSVDAKGLLDAARKAAQPDWRKAEPSVFEGGRFDGDEAPEEFLELRQNVFNKGTAEDDKLAWRAYSLNQLIEGHIRDHAIEVKWTEQSRNPTGGVTHGGPGIGHNEEHAALIRWCQAHGFPILVKLGGCVYADESLGMRINRIATLGGAGNMFPTWLQEAVQDTPTLFAGLSPVEYTFQTFYWRDLDRLFSQAVVDTPRARYLFLPELVDDPTSGAAAPDPLDGPLAKVLAESPYGNGRPNVKMVVGTRPSDVIHALHRRWAEAAKGQAGP